MERLAAKYGAERLVHSTDPNASQNEARWWTWTRFGRPSPRSTATAWTATSQTTTKPARTGVCAALNSLADRIAALLPPREHSHSPPA